MALIGFHKQFADTVARGDKTQTIRKRRLHPICLGEYLHLYVGLKTNDARRLLPPRPCSYVADIVIQPDYTVFVGGDTIGPEYLEEIAKLDGFVNGAAMLAWFKKTYGLPFVGQIIRWIP